MRIRDVLIWLFIFIIGSLIVTFIVNPGYRGSVIETTQEFFSIDNNVDTYPKSQSSPEIKTYRKGSMYQCELIEFMEFQNMMPEPGKKMCELTCSTVNREYHHYACEEDWHMCYCVDDEET